MTDRKTAKDRNAAKAGRAALNVTQTVDETKEAAIARTVLRPTVRGADTWRAFSPRYAAVADAVTLTEELAKQASAVISGNMGRPEAMLVSQAHALDAIFNELARRAALNMGEYLDATDTYLRLALKAQSQCRATLETLSVIKNPPASVAFVKQANIAHGPQQVNNGNSPSSAPRAQGNFNSSNELLEQTNGARLDTITTSAAVTRHPQMEAVAEIFGPKIG